MDNETYRFLKAHTPGAYTFLLKATREVPKRLQHAKCKTIGIRIPDCTIAQELLATLGEPMMNTTLILPREKEPLFDPDEIYEKLINQVDAIIDGGYGDVYPTSVIDLSGDKPTVVRIGKGTVDDL